MDENNGSVFGALILLVSDLAMLDAAFMIFGTDSSRMALSIGFWPWLVLAVLSFSSYQVFLRRERTLLQAAAFLAAAYVVTVTVMFVLFVDLPSPLAKIVAVLFWSVPLLHTYLLTRTPPALEKLTMRLDVVIFVLLFVLLYVIGTGEAYIRALPCVISLLLCLAALIVVRTTGVGADEGGKIRGAAVMLAFLILTGAVITAFLLFASASFGDAVAAGAAALLSALRYAFDLIMRALFWLLSLIPMPDAGGELPPGMAPAALDLPGEAEMIDFGPTVLVVIICVLAALAAAAAIVALVRYRGQRLGGYRVRKTAVVKRRRIRSRASFLRRILNSFKFLGYSILYRNTPQGVFLRIERWGRLRRRGRASSETQRNYLMRLSGDVPENRDALLGLADALDALWYGDPALSQLPRHELIKLRRSFS